MKLNWKKYTATANIRLTLPASIDIPRDFKIENNMCCARKVKKFLSDLIQMRADFTRAEGLKIYCI